MIFNFYENFPNIYPIKMEDLLSPDREKFGYFWEFEDYFVEGVKGNGLELRGFLISSDDDTIKFERTFDRFFLRSSINGIIKGCLMATSNIDGVVEVSPRLVDIFYENLIFSLDQDFQKAERHKNDFFKKIRSSLKEKKIWIVLDSNASSRDIQNFWGKKVNVIMLPTEFETLAIKDVWSEMDELGPIEYSIEMAWTDLSFSYPKLVKYIDEEMRQKTGTDFIGQCHDFGLI